MLRVGPSKNGLRVFQYEVLKASAGAEERSRVEPCIADCQACAIDTTMRACRHTPESIKARNVRFCADAIGRCPMRFDRGADVVSSQFEGGRNRLVGESLGVELTNQSKL